MAGSTIYRGGLGEDISCSGPVNWELEKIRDWCIGRLFALVIVYIIPFSIRLAFYSVALKRYTPTMSFLIVDSLNKWFICMGVTAGQKYFMWLPTGFRFRRRIQNFARLIAGVWTLVLSALRHHPLALEILTYTIHQCAYKLSRSHTRNSKLPSIMRTFQAPDDLSWTLRRYSM